MTGAYFILEDSVLLFKRIIMYGSPAGLYRKYIVHWLVHWLENGKNITLTASKPFFTEVPYCSVENKYLLGLSGDFGR